MKILTHWLRSYLPVLDVDDAQLAEDLTLRGIAVEGIFELSDSSGESEAALFDMDITTNRVDAMNHYGVAREAAAIYDVPLRELDTALPAGGGSSFPVRIEAPERCGRFTAQVIRGVRVGASEGLVRDYFGELGQKQISNAVDATNYVLLGMGQPTHAFDLDKIEGGIVVRLAREGESLRLLDGSLRTLLADDLVIADEVKALSLAGVMGGWDSMITAETKNVLMESAWFAPAGIRASSRRHLIHTDASHRYERGADFAAAPVGNALVTKAILEACGGVLEGAMADVVVVEHAARTTGRAAIEVAVSRVQRLLGTTLAAEGITAELIERYLGALGCTLTPLSDDRYAVRLPSWRLDLEREIDLIEEIARVYGYNGFADTLPTPGVVIAHGTARAEAAVGESLFAMGYSEAISSTFSSAVECEFFTPGVRAIALENPLNEEAAYLRPSLVPGMVTMLAHNLNRDVLTARLFESGAVFGGSTETVEEAASLSFGLTGTGVASSLYTTEDAPFFELKGVIEAILRLFEMPAWTLTTEGVPACFEPGRAAAVMAGGKALGYFGQLAQSEASRRKLRQAVFVGEVRLGDLLKLPLRHSVARELSRFQAVERDFSFVFADGTHWMQVEAAIQGLGITELTSLRPVEIFRDGKKSPGHFSMLVRTVFQSGERTLREEELTGWSGSIITALEGLGGVLRAS